jgi:hypothetical protein
MHRQIVRLVLAEVDALDLGGRRGQVPWLRKFFSHRCGICLVAARTSADWFHEVVAPNAELLLFPNGKTKFVRPDAR